MPIEEVIKELKRLTVALEEIAKEESDVEIVFDVADEYIIESFWEIKRRNYSVKEPVDYKDIPHYYEISCKGRP